MRRCGPRCVRWRLVQRPALAQRRVGDRVEAEREQPLHPDLIHQPDPGTVVQAGEAVAQPTAGRVTVRGVVRRQRHVRCRATSPQQL